MKYAPFDKKDLRIDTYRHGNGQLVSVKATHMPTGMVATGTNVEDVLKELRENNEEAIEQIKAISDFYKKKREIDKLIEEIDKKIEALDGK